MGLSQPVCWKAHVGNGQTSPSWLFHGQAQLPRRCLQGQQPCCLQFSLKCHLLCKPPLPTLCSPQPPSRLIWLVSRSSSRMLTPQGQGFLPVLCPISYTADVQEKAIARVSE